MASTPKEVEIIPPAKKQLTQAEKDRQLELAKANPSGKSDEEEDYDYLRETIRDLIDKNMKKLDEMGELTSQLDQARAFEVYSNMTKDISSLTKDLYDVHKKRKETRAEGKKVDESAITVEKAVFVGTTADLLKQVKNQAKENGES